VEATIQKFEELWGHEGDRDNCKVCRVRDEVRKALKGKFSLAAPQVRGEKLLDFFDE
jgi:hypothetical protein